MDIEKLIERLRTDSLYADKATLEIMDLCMEAADALSTLQAENERLQAELEQVKREKSRIPEGYALAKLELLEELDNFRDLGPIDRLRELAQADRMIGKTVYYPYAGKVLEKRVSHFIIYDERRANLPPKDNWFCVDHDTSETFDFEDIGKTIFLTREEAEAALRREQDG